ncbi:MAG: 50S ribosomal protein L25 [Verrucomicrobiota bacterium]
MAKQVKLAAQTRSGVGRTAVKKIKSQGFVPAVIYAHNQAPVSLQVSERDINTLLSHAVGEHLLVDLEIAGSDNRMALIQEVQHHAVTGKVLHVDFHGVSANEEIESSIPVEPIGEAIGVKSYGGILEQLSRSVSIKCLPKDLPEVINVDVSGLNIGESIHVKDLQLPAGVTAADDAEVTIFMVAEPNVAAEAPAAGAAAAPEVIKEKKSAEEKK